MSEKPRSVEKGIAQALFCAEIHRLLEEYGAVRLAKLDHDTGVFNDTLVLTSPIFCVAGDASLPAATVLDSRLFNLGVLAYGNIRAAAQSWDKAESYHFTESEEEG